jgi:hypothetical protein
MSDEVISTPQKLDPVQPPEVSETPEQQALKMLEAETGEEGEEGAGEDEAAEDPSGERQAQDKAKEAEEKAKKEAETEESPAEKRRSRVIAEMAKKETRLLETERTLRQQQSALQAQVKEMAEWKSQLQLAKTDPMAFFNQLGVDVNALTRQILNDEGPKGDPEVRTLKQKIEEMEARDKARDEALKSTHIQKAVEQEKGLLLNYVQENKTEYPMLASFRPDQIQAAMFDARRESFRAQGAPIEAGKAAQQIEQGLLDLYEQLAQVVAKKRAPGAATQTASSATEGARTLSAKTHSSLTGKSPDDMTDAEREALALEMLTASG